MPPLYAPCSCFSSTYALATFMRAVQSVLTEGRFRVSSQEATGALYIASALTCWCEEPAHCQFINQFALVLATYMYLKTCFQQHSSLKYS